MKRILLSLLSIMFVVMSLGISPEESHANAHSSIQFRDGDATGSSYDPTDVDPAKSLFSNFVYIIFVK